MEKTPEEFKKTFEKCPHGEDCVHCDCTIEECASIQWEQALAYIHQLESQVPRWISVEERMPSEHVSVAVYIDEKAGSYWIQTAYLNGGKWRIPGEFVVDRNITHWMPLPSIPEEVK